MKLSLTDSQLNKISDILVVIGEVLFASVVVRFFVGIDRPNILMLSLGTIITITCWTSSVFIVRRVKYDKH